DRCSPGAQRGHAGPGAVDSAAAAAWQAGRERLAGLGPRAAKAGRAPLPRCCARRVEACLAHLKPAHTTTWCPRSRRRGVRWAGLAAWHCELRAASCELRDAGRIAAPPAEMGQAAGLLVKRLPGIEKKPVFCLEGP